MIETGLVYWLLGWLAAAGFVLVRHWQRGGAGLVFTYVLSYGAMHWLASALYLLPWYTSSRIDDTLVGLEVATIGMVMFAVGCEIGSALFARSDAFPPDTEAGEQESRAVPGRIVSVYLIGGAVIYGGVYPLIAGLPTASALASTSSSLMVLGIALKAWNAWQRGAYVRIWLWLGASIVFPLMTLVGQGFLSFGLASMLIVATFVAGFYRPRWHVVIAGLVVAFLGLSVYVTYMRDRRDIRAVIWAGEAISERFEILQDTFTRMEWFDPTRIEHLRRVDDRLNQNALVGAAVQGIRTGAVEPAWGGTIVDAVIALVPRAIWPSKPVGAGSGDIVSDYTGLTFVEGTSVGVGHVMEWYVNFTMPGIVIGFVLIGAAISYVDRAAAAWLQAGDAGRFTFWFLPGLSLLYVGGSFVEMTATAGASVAVAWALRRVFVHDVEPAFEAKDEESMESLP